jgi:hypothetical protein
MVIAEKQKDQFLSESWGNRLYKTEIYSVKKYEAVEC